MADYGNCVKCGASTWPLYSTVQTATSAGQEMALVAMREGLYLETTEGKRFLTVNEQVKLPFNAMADILAQHGPAFYLKNKIERATFIAAYPEFETWNI